MNYNIEKIRRILADSDIVWPKYGSETVQKLAIKIAKALELEQC